MEAVFLETALMGYGLVDCVICDVGRDGAVKRGVKVGNGYCVWEVGDAGFDDGECSAVVAG
jgi:hypothetical protein